MDVLAAGLRGSLASLSLSCNFGVTAASVPALEQLTRLRELCVKLTNVGDTAGLMCALPGLVVVD